MVPDISIDRSWLHFGLLFLGVSMMFLGASSWVAYYDMNHHYSYSHVQDHAPENSKVGYYDQLSEEERAMFHDAVENGTTYTFEKRNQPPEEVIYYEGQYYVFDKYGTFDWLNPGTSVPVIVGLLGIGLMIDAGRRDVRNRGV